MNRIQRGIAWARTHWTVTAAVAVFVVVALAAAAVLTTKDAAPKVALEQVAGHGHDTTEGPNVLVPLPGVDGIPADSQERLEPLASKSVTPKGAVPPKSSVTPSGSKVNDSKVTVVTSPAPAASNALGFGDELKNPAPTTTAVLLATLALPAGTVEASPTSKYGNGVVEWLYANDTVSYEAMAAHMRGKVTANGWSIVGEPPVFSYPGPNGTTINSRRFYVKQGTAIRGYVIVSSRGDKPGSSIQIDLLGV